MKDSKNEKEIEIQLLCYKCPKIPEILNVNIDNGKIEMKCKHCGIFECDVSKYIDFLKEPNLSQCNCGKEPLYYCYECKENKCDKCKNKKTLHHYIKITERKKCLLHYEKDITKFCVDCQENLCSECYKQHKNHKKENISDLKQDISVSEDNIKNENINLKKIKIFNQIIINLTKNEKIKGVKNINDYIKEEQERNSKQIKFLLKSMEIKKKEHEKAIETLQNDKTINIEPKEEKLSLYGREIDNKKLHLISKIQFKNLREIDLSNNKIINIEPLTRMNLCYLLDLNLSINKIENIEAIPELNEENIQSINLDDNKIKNIQPFLDYDFPKLEQLRIQQNDDIEDKDKKELENKYKNKLSI